MDVLLYISALIVAVAFAILVIYLVRTLKSANKTLTHVASTMESLEKQINGITKETEQLLHRTNALADDIQKKSESLNPVFSSVKDLGQSFQQVNQSIQHVSNTITAKTNQQSEQIAQVVQWGQVALDFYEKLKARKKAENSEIN
ncbi:DUF948 domain-containing protein [Alkalihalobacillus trypoxylicola]|uniref:General stress protein n=1 Tax=Alkalihalobacillus trypoxylicola TaxID=519424 RepID=A0A162CUC3_9BACI|nr:DUF948 domain-containing protein [Alkalihalobacillus trypoxylicola]KYG26676.1 hypothetical protein AZF04_12790 [Alkalihalobacillus trypoxylicola]GAF64266.1 hypothetical protein BTS2_1158 [Bacillus sp. TS-2]